MPFPNKEHQRGIGQFNGVMSFDRESVPACVNGDRRTGLRDYYDSPP
jgi:hypothetical protein